ncbi:pre-mRNA splicing factor [Cyclospora cayetanensis]|uniref:Pre-mRNA splicing factor n=1 Tax=Cyclospora cayetanensis TaxID=88456 RepID=A0A1D3CSY7_9EIME|nr:pre-mRNA splicing factor [Cyclospora cayetanensis]
MVSRGAESASENTLGSQGSQCRLLLPEDCMRNGEQQRLVVKAAAAATDGGLNGVLQRKCILEAVTGCFRLAEVSPSETFAVVRVSSSHRSRGRSAETRRAGSMDQLERLSQISRIATELHNHWGISDKDLAEFVLHLGEESQSLEEFRTKLKANGSAVTQALAVSLYTAISKYVEKTKNAKRRDGNTSSASSKDASSSSPPARVAADSEDASAGGDSGVKTLPASAFSVSQHPPTEKELKFPGLCMQNRFDRAELQLTRPDEHAPLSAAAQRLLQREKDEKELLREQQEAYNKARDAAATVSAAADSSLNFCGRRGAPLERYGIYDGVVSRVMEYGAFVQLDLAEGRKEGLLHAADMSRADGGPCVSA